MLASVTNGPARSAPAGPSGRNAREHSFVNSASKTILLSSPAPPRHRLGFSRTLDVPGVILLISTSSRISSRPWPTQRDRDSQPSIVYETIPLAVVIAVALGLISGRIPAIRAARMTRLTRCVTSRMSLGFEPMRYGRHAWCVVGSESRNDNPTAHSTTHCHINCQGFPGDASHQLVEQPD